MFDGDIDEQREAMKRIIAPLVDGMYTHPPYPPQTAEILLL